MKRAALVVWRGLKKAHFLLGCKGRDKCCVEKNLSFPLEFYIIILCHFLGETLLEKRKGDVTQVILQRCVWDFWKQRRPDFLCCSGQAMKGEEKTLDVLDPEA